MKHPSLPVKRRSVKKGALRTLFVNVARSKRHRAAIAPAMPDAEGDVPNVGVARALGVILAIHVVAFAGILIHSRYFETKTDTAASGAKPAVAAAAATAPGDKSQAKLDQGTRRHVITTGESYADIARMYDLDVKQLQEANGNVELRAGNFLKLPPKQIVAVQPPEIAAVRENNLTASLNTDVTTAPIPVAKDSLRESPPMVEAKPPRAILVKPTVTRQSESDSTVSSNHPKAAKIGSSASKTTSNKETASTPPAKKSGKVVVKSGETLWSIAKANGTTPAALMKANGVKDASKLRTGMELSIPKN
jgi:LysM repeat protein